jgi:predicted lipoprotein with Yx(FWY)xxD motif
MLKRTMVLLPLLLALVVAAVSAQDNPTVETTDDPELGTYLVDSEGMTLYLFTKDVPGSGKSVCNDQCAENWPPFAADDPLSLPEGVPGELTQIIRDDGSQQVAYNGQPLYYYVQDKEPGDTTGQDVGEVWYVVSPGEPGATPQASPGATPMATPATPAT